MPLANKPKVELQPRVTYEITSGDASENVQVGMNEIEAIYSLISDLIVPKLSRFVRD
jgi:hypothetical protein